ncbi:hypothetical protein [Streptomyces phaeochromogenes]|uniref:hypothetical protein n=1 Tax=Streptomyces phaeochromogenes TaxID=1923 RepID=UPI0027D8C288|nr:hypothetical protein [Streptomyces phaeochromogenes]
MNNRNNGLDLRTALLLFVGAAVTYIAFVHPAIGVALLVGVGVMTVLHVLLK